MAAELVCQIRANLSSQGFDICEPFKVSVYNSLVSTKNTSHCLQTFNRAHPLGLIIGSSKAFWSGFAKYVKSTSLPIKDPVDTYCCTVIDQALASVSCKKEIRYSHYLPASGKFAHMQTAGHIAGVAYYYPELFWSVHPKFGLWFVYRAVAVLDIDFDLPDPPTPLPLLSSEQQEEIIRLNKLAWETQSGQAYYDARDVYPVEAVHKYDGDIKDMFCFHKAAEVLQRLRN